MADLKESLKQALEEAKELVGKDRLKEAADEFKEIKDSAKNKADEIFAAKNGDESTSNLQENSDEKKFNKQSKDDEQNIDLEVFSGKGRLSPQENFKAIFVLYGVAAFYFFSTSDVYHINLPFFIGVFLFLFFYFTIASK